MPSRLAIENMTVVHIYIVSVFGMTTSTLLAGSRMQTVSTVFYLGITPKVVGPKSILSLGSIGSFQVAYKN